VRIGRNRLFYLLLAGPWIGLGANSSSVRGIDKCKCLLVSIEIISYGIIVHVAYSGSEEFLVRGQELNLINFAIHATMRSDISAEVFSVGARDFQMNTSCSGANQLTFVCYSCSVLRATRRLECVLFPIHSETTALDRLLHTSFKNVRLKIAN
jgi:hypothetical protein